MQQWGDGVVGSYRVLSGSFGFNWRGGGISGAAYERTLGQESAPDIKMETKNFSDPDLWLRQQNMAPPRGESWVKKLLADKKASPDALPRIPKDADASPLDFSIWGWIDAQLNELRDKTEIKDESDLRAALPETQSKLPRGVVDNCVTVFRKRATANGGHIEHNISKK